MLTGKTEAETLALNGWTVGDILEGGTVIGCPAEMKIMAIEYPFIHAAVRPIGEFIWGPCLAYTKISKEWHKVGRVEL